VRGRDTLFIEAQPLWEEEDRNTDIPQNVGGYNL